MKKTILQGRSTYDGAGVKLNRIFANDQAELTDPFLLLDHFGSDNPDDYIKGFPWHPHRGIETVTYMLGGIVEHGDNIGNSGTIGPGDIQWMTAGSGIIHQEMPKKGKDKMHGLQLWVNLPAASKMTKPRYRGIGGGDIPVVNIPGGKARVIAGIFGKKTGPVKELTVDVEYLDVRLTTGATLSHKIRKGFTAICYMISGTGNFDNERVRQGQLVLLRDPGTFVVKAEADLQYLFAQGRQLNEPIAWGGPIVMNTQDELNLAFRELDEGTFIKNLNDAGKK